MRRTWEDDCQLRHCLDEERLAALVLARRLCLTVLASQVLAAVLLGGRGQARAAGLPALFALVLAILAVRSAPEQAFRQDARRLYMRGLRRLFGVR